MNERIRLTDPPPEVHALPRALRIAHDKPVIGFVDLRRSGERQATRQALEAAMLGRVHTLRILARSRPGHELLMRGETIDGIAASLDVLPAAIASVLAELPPHDLLLAEGVAALAHLRTDLSLVVSDRLITDWPRDLRAMRGELDLILTEARPRTFETLIKAKVLAWGGPGA